MKNKIYMSLEAKKGIENKIDKLVKKAKIQYKNELINSWSITQGKIAILKEILESTIVLPVEKDQNTLYSIVDGADTKSYYPQGVIIQPKLVK